VADNYPCGFCGQAISGSNCTAGIAGGKKVNSSCPHSYPFQITAASKSSAAKPCTNVPMRCDLCTDIHWKYNMMQHLQDRHPTWETTMPAPNRDALASKISITREEYRLGVPEPAQTAAARTVDDTTTGQKRPPSSPAGSPRRSRILKTLLNSVAEVRRQGEAGNSSSSLNGDVFT
ncbi:hypothetical protein B0H10DRAFT_1816716, partial [Mycena sp. CBHHK59/15]